MAIIIDIDIIIAITLINISLPTIMIPRPRYHCHNVHGQRRSTLPSSYSFAAMMLVVTCTLLLSKLPVTFSWIPKPLPAQTSTMRRQYIPASSSSLLFAATTQRKQQHQQQRQQQWPFSKTLQLVEGWFPSLPIVHPFQQTKKDHIMSQELPRLVIIIPAYNEEHRILSTLQTYWDYFQQQQTILTDDYFSYCDIVLVDDGSTDKTIQVVESFWKEHCPDDNDNDTSFLSKITCLSLPSNQGKGAALAAGIHSIAKQQYNMDDKDDDNIVILTLDADGSGNLEYLPSMMDRLKALITVSVGNDDDNNNNNNNNNKALSSKPSSTRFIDWSQPAIVTGNRNYQIMTPRGITRWGFQTTVRIIMNNLRVQDSQCGYKLLTLTAAQDLYHELQIVSWAHDVEVLYRAKLVQFPIDEVAIDWKDQDGSKVVDQGVAKVSLEMLRDVIQLRWIYSNFRAWLNLGDF